MNTEKRLEELEKKILNELDELQKEYQEETLKAIDNGDRLGEIQWKAKDMAIHRANMCIQAVFAQEQLEVWQEFIEIVDPTIQ